MRPQLRLPVCLKLHTAVLAGHGVCGALALPPSLSSLVLLNVMRDARSLSLADMVGAPGGLGGARRRHPHCGTVALHLHYPRTCRRHVVATGPPSSAHPLSGRCRG